MTDEQDDELTEAEGLRKLADDYEMVGTRRSAEARLRERFGDEAVRAVAGAFREHIYSNSREGIPFFRRFTHALARWTSTTVGNRDPKTGEALVPHGKSSHPDAGSPGPMKGVEFEPLKSTKNFPAGWNVNARGSGPDQLPAVHSLAPPLSGWEHEGILRGNAHADRQLARAKADLLRAEGEARRSAETFQATAWHRGPDASRDAQAAARADYEAARSRVVPNMVQAFEANYERAARAWDAGAVSCYVARPERPAPRHEVFEVRAGGKHWTGQRWSELFEASGGVAPAEVQADGTVRVRGLPFFSEVREADAGVRDGTRQPRDKAWLEEALRKHKARLALGEKAPMTLRHFHEDPERVGHYELTGLELVQVNPDEAPRWTLVGTKVYESREAFEKAKNHDMRSIEVSPDSPTELAALALLRDRMSYHRYPNVVERVA